jgi:hypothetical protein
MVSGCGRSEVGLGAIKSNGGAHTRDAEVKGAVQIRVLEGHTINRSDSRSQSSRWSFGYVGRFRLVENTDT